MGNGYDADRFWRLSVGQCLAHFESVAVVRREQNEMAESHSAVEQRETSAPIRGMGGSSSTSSSKVKGLPDRSKAKQVPPRGAGGARRGSVTDLLSIFGQAGVAQINVATGTDS